MRASIYFFLIVLCSTLTVAKAESLSAIKYLAASELAADYAKQCKLDYNMNLDIRQETCRSFYNAYVNYQNMLKATSEDELSLLASELNTTDFIRLTRNTKKAAETMEYFNILIEMKGDK